MTAIGEADIQSEIMKPWLHDPLKSELEHAPGVKYIPRVIQEDGIKEKVYSDYTASTLR